MGGNFKNVDQCASQAMCFWDNTVCINVIQATNVCSVLEQPQPCSTNPLCHWQNNKCELANIPAPLAGGLRLQKTLDMPKATNTSSKTADYLIMFACGFTGALIGLLFALVTQKSAKNHSKEERSTIFTEILFWTSIRNADMCERPIDGLKSDPTSGWSEQTCKEW